LQCVRCKCSCTSVKEKEFPFEPKTKLIYTLCLYINQTRRKRMRQHARQRSTKMREHLHLGIRGKRTWLLALSLFCWCTTAVAQTTYTSVQSGSWSNPATWGTTTIPGTVEGDVVIISTGHTVTLDVSVSPTNTLASVTVNGTLLYDAGPPRILRARNVTVNSGGTIDLIVPVPPHRLS